MYKRFLFVLYINTVCLADRTPPSTITFAFREPYGVCVRLDRGRVAWIYVQIQNEEKIEKKKKMIYGARCRIVGVNVSYGGTKTHWYA